MPHTIKLQTRKVIQHIMERMRYLIKEKRFETQEEVLIRLLKIKGASE